MPNSDDTNGRKPYTTYRSGRARRSSLDDELANARPSSPPSGKPTAGRRQVPRQRSEHEPRSGSRDDQAGTYRVYTSHRGNGRQNGGSAQGNRRSPRQHRIRWWIVPVALLLVTAIAGVVLTVLAWPGYKTFDRAVDKSNKQVDGETRAQLDDDEGSIWRKGTTVLLFGVDSKAGEPARSDTIMLMRFDPGSRTVNQLSIPRDTRVPLSNGGYDKINAAMFWGGPAMATKAVKDYLGIDVNHVMVVNFKGFPRIVDAVGGVDINVPKTVTTVAGSQGRTVVFEKGMNHLDGKYAMLYVRIRYADDDIHRAQRQQQFIQALQTKIAQPSNIPRLPEVGKRFMNGVATDLTTNEMLQLGLLKWRAKGGKKLVLSGTPGLEGGVSYIYPPSDEEKRRIVQRFLGQ